MQGKIEFPLFKTKVEGLNQKFNLTNPEHQKQYFQAKVGKEIKKIQDYLKNSTFIAYFLAKKNAGKGTYSKMFREATNPERVEHISVGDSVRELDNLVKDPERKKELERFLEQNYRGWVSVVDVMKSIEERSTRNLLSNELILTLIKAEIEKKEKKALFLDGFPRNLDQVSHSLFFRDLVGYREDPDFFVLIDVPTAVIDERIKWRRMCPRCQTPRNLKLLSTSKIGYKKETGQFYLICDSPSCSTKTIEMIAKEGDELGTEPIKERIKADEELMNQAFSIYGLPKVLLRNTVPVDKAKEYVDDYEITPEYVYEWDVQSQKVVVKEKPWVVNDDQGIPSYSLLPSAVVVSLIKQISGILL